MRSWELKKSYSICGKNGLNSMFVHVFPSEVMVTSWNEYVGDYIKAKKERSDAADYFKTARKKGLKIERI